jgi:hypothetical protein
MAGIAGAEEFFCRSAAEGPDHGSMCKHFVLVVQAQWAARDGSAYRTVAAC